MKNFYYIFIFLLCHIATAQVGFNTDNPSTASTLHIEAEYSTGAFGGLKLPVVTLTQRNNIRVDAETMRDDGLMVYVHDEISNTFCWQIYDAKIGEWNNIQCFTKTCGGTPLFSENFQAYTLNTGITGTDPASGDYPTINFELTSFTAGTSTASYPGTLVNADDYAKVVDTSSDKYLSFRDTGGPLRYTTIPAIDIVGYANVSFSIDISSASTLEYDDTNHTDDFNCTGGNDYVDVEYSLNGGQTFIEVPNYNGQGNANHTFIGNIAPTTLSVSNLVGSSLIIRVRVQNNEDDELISIDNVSVTCGN
ncbi:hypothetical protein ACFSQ0_04010 [Mesonia sediminis]|uniref:Uncharacterized protein n=1 Tax=Mesonia sediminis TaxID=1703946 RepID=A0ABW5SEN6_9FLAO